MPRLISASAAAGLMRVSSGWANVWCATVWPSASARRASAGALTALRPSRKKVARTHSCLSASSTRFVVPGHGPSSNVSTTSLSASGSVAGNSFRPTRGVVAALTVRTRSVPSASGLPGQGAAGAAAAADAKAQPSRSRIRITAVSLARSGDTRFGSNSTTSRGPAFAVARRHRSHIALIAGRRHGLSHVADHLLTLVRVQRPRVGTKELRARSVRVAFEYRMTSPAARPASRLIAPFALVMLAMFALCTVLGYALARQSDERHQDQRRASLLGVVDEFRNVFGDMTRQAAADLAARSLADPAALARALAPAGLAR